MNIWLNVFYTILIILPLMCYGPLTVYLIDGVLRYKVIRKPLTYISTASVGIVLGIVKSWVKYTEDTAVVLDVFEMICLLGIISLILYFNMKDKWWRKIIIIILASGIITNINEIFSILKDQFFEHLPWSNAIVVMLVFTLYELIWRLIEFLFFYVIKRIRSRRDDTPLPIPVILIFTIVINIFSNLAFVDGNFEDVFDSKVRTVMIMLSALLFILLYFYIRVTRKERDSYKELNTVNEELVESQTKYFEDKARSDNEIRAMRHDMKNNVQVLMLLLENGEYDQMKEYLEEMGENLQVADISAHTGNTVADAIIADKTSQASAKGIKLKSSGVISGVDISPVDTCRILANLLDNAIEAVSADELSDLDPDSKLIDLQFKKTENYFTIVVTNPCYKVPEIEDGKIVTSKSDKNEHGFGMSNIKNAADNYEGELQVSCDPKPYGFEFTAQIVFPVKREDLSDFKR